MPSTRRPLQPTASALHFFGAELRHWRSLRRLSQEQVATRVLHGKDLICKIEKADRRPTRDLARRLDEVLDAGGALNRLYALVEAEASGARATRTSGRRVAICGSRCDGTDPAAIDEAVRGLARVVMSLDLDVRHGPVGVGIEVVTFAADRYQRGSFEAIVSVLGRPNVVRDVEAVVVVGGGAGTRDEVDLAAAAGVPVIPLAATGGAARHAHARLVREAALRWWISDADLAGLACVGDADRVADLVERLLDQGRAIRARNRPYTVLSCAMTIDGYATDATSARLLLSDDEDIDGIDAVRASVDAVLIGATSIGRDRLVRSADSDLVALSRDSDLVALSRDSDLVALSRDSDLVALSRDSDLVALSRDSDSDGDGAPAIVYGPSGVADRVRDRISAASTVVDMGDRLSLEAVLSDLSDRGVRRLMIDEARTQFLARDLIDEVQLTVIPFAGARTGTRARTGSRPGPDVSYPFSSTAMSLAGVEHLRDRVRLRYVLAAVPDRPTANARM